MNRNDMDARFRKALLAQSRWYDDDPRNPPQRVLDALAAVAEQHAEDVQAELDADARAEHAATRDRIAAAAETPAPRRTTRRTTGK